MYSNRRVVVETRAAQDVYIRAKEVSQSGGVRRGVRGCIAFLLFFNTKIPMGIPDVFLYSDSLRKRYIVHCYVTIPRIDIEALPAELREGHHEGGCRRVGWAGQRAGAHLRPCYPRRDKTERVCNYTGKNY